jgi:threonine/homoserine/homoserine lactone efflux protein
MIAWHLFVLYIGALIVVYALPGPDMALVLQTSVRYGARHGLVNAAGLACARCAHVTLSACGVAALFQRAPWLYETVRIVGAFYLAYIAFQIFRSPNFGLGEATNETRDTPSYCSAYARGILSSLLNPKALLFCSILLPQFVSPEAGPLWLQMLVLGITLVVIGLLFDVSTAFGAARLSRWLQHHPQAQTAQRWTFSLVLLGFALRVAAD